MEGNGRKANKARSDNFPLKRKSYEKVQINRIPSHKFNK